MRRITLDVNGEKYFADVEPYDSLNKVLREYLGLLGTKKGCDYGGCGSCTVLLDGKAIYSCMMPANKVGDAKIVTIEGIGTEDHLDVIQEEFIRHFALQCGFCTPGLIMSAKALLTKNPEPTELDVRESISGNMCRCTGYTKIVDAVLAAARRLGQ